MTEPLRWVLFRHTGWCYPHCLFGPRGLCELTFNADSRPFLYCRRCGRTTRL